MAISLPSNVAALDPQQRLAKNQTPSQRPARPAETVPSGLTATQDVVDLGRSRPTSLLDSGDPPLSGAEQVPQALRSRSSQAPLTDADAANGSAEGAAEQIRSQPRTAYLAQANLSAETVLRLLR